MSRTYDLQPLRVVLAELDVVMDDLYARAHAPEEGVTLFKSDALESHDSEVEALTMSTSSNSSSTSSGSAKKIRRRRASPAKTRHASPRRRRETPSPGPGAYNVTMFNMGDKNKPPRMFPGQRSPSPAFVR